METLAQVLTKMALAHCDRKFKEYVANLEEIAESAKVLAADRRIDEIEEAQKLREAIARSRKWDERIAS